MRDWLPGEKMTTDDCSIHPTQFSDVSSYNIHRAVEIRKNEKKSFEAEYPTVHDTADQFEHAVGNTRQGPYEENLTIEFGQYKVRRGGDHGFLAYSVRIPGSVDCCARGPGLNFAAGGSIHN